MILTHDQLVEEADLYSRLRHEQDGRAMADTGRLDDRQLETLITELKNSEVSDPNEPNMLPEIERLCPFGVSAVKPDKIESRILGAVAGRFAGCTLGVPVEGYSIENMRKIANDGGTPFTPNRKWHTLKRTGRHKKGVGKRG